MSLVFYSDSDDPEPWREALARALPGLAFRASPDIGDPLEVRYTLVWKPPQGWHRQFPKLRAILSLGAGVDSLLEDPTLPDGIPVTRMVDAGMGRQMAEYALYGVMHFHRGMHHYARQQRAGTWVPRPPVAAKDFRVGVMGLGVLGLQAAALIRSAGYPVIGWSRSGTPADGLQVYAGAGEFAAFAGQVSALVNFLPLTPDTRGIIDARLLAALPRGAFVINLARGGHVVDADLLAALDSGGIGGAMLDVFQIEPLPPGHPYWSHPGVVVTPHVAAVIQAEDAASQVVENLKRLERGESPLGVVDRRRGY